MADGDWPTYSQSAASDSHDWSEPASYSDRMSPTDKTLFTTKEVCEVLALSQSSVRRLTAEGQMNKVYPRPRTMRITHESLGAHLKKSGDRAAVTQAAQQQLTA